MKRLTTLLATLVLALALSLPALASTCPRLVKQIDAKLSSMNMPTDKVAKIKALRDKGEQLHKEGKHSASVAALQEALKMLEM